MKVIHDSVFWLVSCDYNFCKEFKSVDKLISEIRGLAKSAEENMEPTFTYHILAVKAVVHKATVQDKAYGRSDYTEYKKAPFATLCYTSDGELNINYHFKFE